MTDQFRTVTEEEFRAFINAYPRRLERDVFMAAEPPFVSYNDFERAPYWPDSIVATSIGDTYRVLIDINAPVVSSIKPDLEPLADQNGVDVQVGDLVDVHWGTSFTEHGQQERIRRHNVVKNDVGTNYERWGITGCANNLRSMGFVKVEDGGA